VKASPREPSRGTHTKKKSFLADPGTGESFKKGFAMSKRTGNGPAPFKALGVKKNTSYLSGSKFPMEPDIIIIDI